MKMIINSTFDRAIKLNSCMYEFEADLTNVKHSVAKPLFLVGFLRTWLCERMSHICEVICGTPVDLAEV